LIPSKPRGRRAARFEPYFREQMIGTGRTLPSIGTCSALAFARVPLEDDGQLVQSGENGNIVPHLFSTATRWGSPSW
jgi:hypothetical protein